MIRDRRGTTSSPVSSATPLDHTLSPAMHNAAYEQLGLDWVYVPLRCPTRSVFDGSSPRLRRCRSWASTSPCRTSGRAGAVRRGRDRGPDGRGGQHRPLRRGRLIGYNTDGVGCSRRSRARPGFDAEGKDGRAPRRRGARGRGAGRARSRARRRGSPSRAATSTPPRSSSSVWPART